VRWKLDFQREVCDDVMEERVVERTEETYIAKAEGSDVVASTVSRPSSILSL
jgi:hypothetical protein